MGTENAILAATLAEGHTTIRPGGPGARGRRPHRVPPEDGRRGRADRPRHDRGRGPRRLRGADHKVIPDRIEAGTFLVAAAVTGGRRDARRRAVRAPRRPSSRSLDATRRAGRLRRRHDRGRRRPGSSRGDFRAVDIETAPTRASRRTCSRRRACCSPRPSGTSHVHETIFEDRLEWLAELAQDGRRHRHRATRTTRRSTGPSRAPRRGGRDRRPARRRVADPGRARRRRHDARFTARTTFGGGMRTSNASSSISARRIERVSEGSCGSPAHEDRHRSRHGQRPRLRQGQGHRHHTSRRVVAVGDDNRIVAVGEEAREMIGRTPGNIHGHPADEGRRHRRLRHHRGDAPATSSARSQGRHRLRPSRT